MITTSAQYNDNDTCMHTLNASPPPQALFLTHIGMLLLATVALKISLSIDDSTAVSIAWCMFAHRMLSLAVTVAPSCLLSASVREIMHAVVSMVASAVYLPQLLRCDLTDALIAL